jgi:predicted AAA+ superfamily ATPase
MEELFSLSYKYVKQVDDRFKRYLYQKIDWQSRLVIIIGARGIGKSTMMLQYMKENLALNKESIYISADHLYFSRHGLVEFANLFSINGGKHLFIDEIHKYPNWSREVKNIYDQYPDLKLVLSGSSATEIVKGEGDLSRRALFYQMQGLSFREFIDYQYQIQVQPIELDELLTSYIEISYQITEKIKPIKLYDEYLRFGYYPFFKEGFDGYYQRINQVVKTVLESDIPAVYNIDYHATVSIRNLLGIITTLVPFKPNTLKLSQQVNLSRETFIKYLQYLQKADLVMLLHSSTKGISQLNKPEKIYLHNPNLIYALAEGAADKGNLRETFFINQLSGSHQLTYPKQGDFLVDNTWLFEVGGLNKTRKQLAGIERAFVAADDIEIGSPQKIPLWMFGFLY